MVDYDILISYIKNTHSISNKDILYSTGKYSHYLIITFNGAKSIKILNPFAIPLKLIL